MLTRVWPMHANVQDGAAAYGRFMTGPRDVNLDDPYWRARLNDGSIALHDPMPPAPAGKGDK